MTVTRESIDAVAEVLTHHVRLLSVEQIDALLGISGVETETLVTDLVNRGLAVIELRFVTRPEVTSPVLSWRPGEPTPDCKRAAAQLRGRSNADRETRLVFPTALACKRYGGTRVRPRASELNHDLRLSEVFMRHQAAASSDGSLDWVSGDSLRSEQDARRFGGATPDACLTDRDGAVERIVEVGGEGYGKGKLEAMHQQYSGYAYEIW